MMKKILISLICLFITTVAFGININTEFEKLKTLEEQLFSQRSVVRKEEGAVVVAESEYDSAAYQMEQMRLDDEAIREQELKQATFRERMDEVLEAAADAADEVSGSHRRHSEAHWFQWAFLSIKLANGLQQEFL